MDRKFNFANTVMVNSTVLPHFRKTDSIMYLPYMKPLREKMRRLHLFDCEESFSAFTLAETLITLTILGVVAAITIPALINRQQEAANRTKLKKAMSMYEKALNQMIIENDLKTNRSIIDFGAEGGACANTTEYFKKVEEKTPCRFKTADRIWWDITDIENPLIILNDKKKDETIENLQALAKDTNDITTYAMIGRLDETTNAGIVRINDNAFEQANGTDDQKAYMSKLYGFINSIGNKNKDSDVNIDVFNRSSLFQDEFSMLNRILNGDITLNECANGNNTNCVSKSTISIPGGGKKYEYTINADGVRLLAYDCSSSNYKDCDFSHKYLKNSDGVLHNSTYTGNRYITYSKDDYEETFSGCSSDFDVNSCTNVSITGENNVFYTCTYSNGNASNCTSSEGYDYTIYADCTKENGKYKCVEKNQ